MQSGVNDAAKNPAAPRNGMCGCETQEGEVGPKGSAEPED